VFICACQKVGIETALQLVTFDDVRNDRRVQVPEVRQTVGVIDRGCDVKTLHLQKDKV
jgi:hypothetical protein